MKLTSGDEGEQGQVRAREALCEAVRTRDAIFGYMPRPAQKGSSLQPRRSTLIAPGSSRAYLACEDFNNFPRGISTPGQVLQSAGASLRARGTFFLSHVPTYIAI